MAQNTQSKTSNGTSKRLSLDELLTGNAIAAEVKDVTKFKDEATGKVYAITLIGRAPDDSEAAHVALALAQRDKVKVEVKGLDAGAAKRTITLPTVPDKAALSLLAIREGNVSVVSDVAPETLERARQRVSECIVPAPKTK